MRAPATLDRRRLVRGLAGGALLAAAGARATADEDDADAVAAFAEAVRLREAALGGRIGVAVHDLKTNQRWDYRADERFPLNSTFKTLACAALLARVDAGAERLDREIPIAEADLVPYAPVTEPRAGDAMTLGALCQATLETSDNTAANLILEALGGPQAVTAFARALGDEHTRLDRLEPDLNAAVPDDPRDTTTPAAMVSLLETIVLGDALSKSSGAQLRTWMERNRVAGTLIRAGVPADWTVADRSGAGGHGSRSATAVAWPPGEPPIVIAIYITGAADASFRARDAAIAGITGDIVATVRPRLTSNRRARPQTAD